LGEDGNRKTERDGASRGRVNFHQKITRDRFPSSPASAKRVPLRHSFCVRMGIERRSATARVGVA
ncbi:MAG TPA: hypothetical protein VJH33_02730, partial [Candidatus Paceibacterota bacterium]